MPIDWLPRELRTYRAWSIAHRLPDEVAAAYLRSDFLDKRVNLIADWEKFCLSKCNQQTPT